MNSQSIAQVLAACRPGTADSLRRALGKQGETLALHRVETRTELQQALEERHWQLIFGELELADFTALELAGAVTEHGVRAPIVLIADTGTEAIALRCLESGVDQCVLNNAEHLKRLPALVKTLLERAEREAGHLRIQQDLLESKERYLDVFDNTSDLIQCLSPDGNFHYTNRTWRDVMGYTEDEVGRLNLLDVLHPDSVLCCQDRFDRLKRGESLQHIEFKFLTKSGDTVHLAGDCGSIIKDGEAVSTRGIFKNVTATVQAEEALRISEARYQALYENAPDIYTTLAEDGRILSINRTGVCMLGYEAKELIGRPAVDIIHPEDQRALLAYIRKQFYQSTPDDGIEYRVVRKDGSVLWVHQRVSLEPKVEEPRLLVVCRDITEKRHLQEQLTHQATHDALTNLINRREFEQRLQRVLSGVSESAENHALCYLDLDQFKVINDTCGHIAGDELLRQIAGLLTGQIRSRDTLARLGGDEFAVLMEHCPLDQALRLADKMREIIEKFRFQWQSRRFTIGASIGVVPIRAESSVEEVISLADSACYVAKEKGRNHVHVYRPDETVTAGPAVADIPWASTITEALEQDQFELFAQPLYPSDGNAQGNRLEILLRLRHADQTLLPGAFLPAAERYNLITKLDRWVLDNVMRWFETHPETLRWLEFCSVNLSGLSLCDDIFRQFVFERLQSSTFPPHKLCFEVTETAAISNLSRSTHFINSLQKTGCRFSLDDFGSGLSSFAYLKSFPADMIKIDAGFVRNVAKNEIDRCMVKSVCDIAAMANKQTVAEGVENAAMLSVLRDIGVDYVQGYHLGKPAPLEQFCREIEARNNIVVSINR